MTPGAGLSACRAALVTMIMSLFAVMVGTPENPWLCYVIWDMLILPWNEAQLRFEFLVLVTFFVALVLALKGLNASGRAVIIAIGGGLSACLAVLITWQMSMFTIMMGTPENPWLYYWLWDMLALPWTEAQLRFEFLILMMFSIVLGSVLALVSRRAQCEVKASPFVRREACDVPESFRKWQEPVKEFDDQQDLDTASTTVPSPASSAPSSPMSSPMSYPFGLIGTMLSD